MRIEHRARLEPHGSCAHQRIGRHHGSRIVLRAVDPVRITGQRVSLDALQCQGQRQQEFAVAATATALRRDARLAAADDRAGQRHRPLPAQQVTCEPRMDKRHLARLALKIIAEHQRMIARPARDLCRRIQGGKAAADEDIVHPRKGRVAGFGGLDQRGRFNAKPREDRFRLRARGRVRHGRPRGDDRKIIARHIGNDERHHARGRAGGGELAALDRRQVLAHAIHLGDPGAAGEQGSVHRLLLRQRKARCRQGQQGRAATRNQAEHEIVRPRRMRQRENALRRRKARRVRHGMGGLHHLDMRGVRSMAVACHDKPFQRPAPMRLDSGRHARRRLARAQHDRASLGGLRQMRGQAERRVRGRDGGGKHLAKQSGLHRLTPPDGSRASDAPHRAVSRTRRRHATAHNP